MPVSKVRQNYNAESEAGVNKQINLNLYAFYAYRSLVSRHTFGVIGLKTVYSEPQMGSQYSYCKNRASQCA